ncbi:MAG: hypothetical protein GY798_33645 [Hyphomicrobiales bacterium]|nr:hypothetical protein [Hyphomicrobiales bacterium]
MKTSIAAVCFTVPLVMGGASNAQDTIPNLVGTWELAAMKGQTHRGDPIVLHEDHKMTIVITKQDGPIISGVKRWHLAEGEAHLHDGEELTTHAEETIMGVLNLDNETFTVVDHPDTTIWQLRLNEDGTLDGVAFEGGPHAFVGRATYTRQ